MEQINRLIRSLICIPILFYRFLVSPIITPCCRYYPSCSEYALTAIRQYGVFKGIWLALCRLLRCHPWSKGGYDPVSPNKEKF